VRHPGVLHARAREKRLPRRPRIPGALVRVRTEHDSSNRGGLSIASRGVLTCTRGGHPHLGGVDRPFLVWSNKLVTNPAVKMEASDDARNASPPCTAIVRTPHRCPEPSSVAGRACHRAGARSWSSKRLLPRHRWCFHHLS